MQLDFSFVFFTHHASNHKRVSINKKETKGLKSEETVMELSSL